MQLTPHFSLEELTHSDTAVRLGLDNTPTALDTANLTRLAEKLEEVRAALGVAMHINVAFRSPPVNRAVGGVPNSAHQLGLAADFVAPGFGTPLQICQRIIERNIVFDQLIWEGTWVHLGLSATGARMQVLTKRPGSTKYLPGLQP